MIVILLLIVEGVMIATELVVLVFMIKHIDKLRNYIGELDDHLNKLRTYLRKLDK